MYYARSKGNEHNKEFQSLKEHLINCAEVSKEKAEKFGAGDFGYICGLLHDIGKYSEKFQNKLQGESVGVRHTAACGELAIKTFGPNFGKLLAYVVTGHHTGLKNCGTPASKDDGTLSARLNEFIEDYSNFTQEIEIKDITLSLPFRQPKSKLDLGFSMSFFIRMLYSTLVDSDFIDTETFMRGNVGRGKYHTIDDLSNKFNEFLKTLDNKENTFINKKRNEILNRCIHFAQKEQGLYSLTVPTGGGKTFSSLAFALNHAKEHNLDRIIYVIPYTSIIEQNAEVFKSKLYSDCILEHHSNFIIERESDDDRLKLASENWDIPIIVTTNVQFFESLYANRSSKCRKLHNISKSVIIFDEVQMLPIDYLKCCIKAITELVKNYAVTAVLCTATQPSFDMFLDNDIQIEEIIENKDQLYLDFKKVEIIKKGQMSNLELLDELTPLKQVLCIVNTKKHAKEIFDGLDGEKSHLSTNMCAKHRQEILKNIKKKLESGSECRVVSTQLIEAGVDVDFPVVYRAMAGLDSIIQSAGRCNREGTKKIGIVNVFEPTDKSGQIKGYIERCAKISQEIFRNFEDVLTLDAIKKYFELLYSIQGKQNLDKKRILECFDTPIDFDFEKAAENFNLIENNTTSIVIPFDEVAIKLINKAKYSDFPMSVMRALQPYTVDLYSHQFELLQKEGKLDNINETFWVLNNIGENYNNETGIIIPKGAQGDAIIV